MKISVDDQEILTLTEIQKQVIMNDIDEEIFEEDMKRRIKYILMDKYSKCFERLKKEWEPKLIQNGIDSIPTDPEKYAALVFSQADYKNKSQRNADEKNI